MIKFQILIIAIFFVLPIYAQKYTNPEVLKLEGLIHDESDNPLPFAFINIPTRATGTISNAQGLFSLTISKAYLEDTLVISHLSFESFKAKLSDYVKQRNNVVVLKQKPFMLKEVVVESLDPVKLIETSIAKITNNYYNDRHVTTGFYRIDTKRDAEHIQLSEAVFEIFNHGYGKDKNSLFKLIKMRAIKDEKASHGLDLGLKPKGVYEFDVIKNIRHSEVLGKKNLKKHVFDIAGIVDYKGTDAYEVTFDQRDGLKESLYEGKIFIDVNSLALLSIEYSRSKKGILYAQYGDAPTRALMKIVGIDIGIKNEFCKINYEKYGDAFVLSTVKNIVTLNFKSERSHYDFTCNTVVDYVVTAVDTTRQNEFTAEETLGNNKLIEFQNLEPDSDFWKGYNTILPDYNANAIAKAIKDKNNSYNLRKQVEPRLAKLPEDVSLRIDTIINFYHKNGEFNGNALVKHNGKLVLQKYYGKATTTPEQLHNNNSEFRIGSLTKSFTSILIFQLINEGKIELTDSIGKFIPWYIHKYVTIEHLLTHTSGIPNYTNNIAYLTEILTQEIPLKDIITRYCSDSLEFKSGDKFQYSNSGFVILAAIAEVVSGQRYGDLLQQSIFEPALMTHSKFAATALNTTGYLYGKPEPRYPVANVAGAGGISSTTKDLMLFGEALRNNKLLPDSYVQKMYKPKALYNDWDGYYAYGWMVDRFMFKASKNHTIIYHPGTDFGYYAMFVQQPDNDNIVILLNNTGDFPRFDMTDLILNELNR
ncbi:MAG TPA: serine hydrolase [Ohtaekwangia sp.]|uniref:serine hydrolase n=1 Tax=Ohtaekwangia sp. TaxID=2066019 RepID=UPI002F93E6B1